MDTDQNYKLQPKVPGLSYPRNLIPVHVSYMCKSAIYEIFKEILDWCGNSTEEDLYWFGVTSVVIGSLIG